MTLKYRADIDGLRAVAVLSVLLYHVGSGVFSGGYVGVDIFFVISGYLITTIILREVENGSFSIVRFYERRARRILPALAAVMLVALPLGTVLLTPFQLRKLAESAVAAAAFCSNVLFYATSGYFDGPAAFKPLLHTWSLAVEEQYYIFFPLMLLLIARYGGRRYFRWVAGLGLLSFLGCVLVTRVDATAAFYLIPTRAWELFIGSVLSLKVFAEPRNRGTREAIAALGAALVAWAVFGYTPDTSFPGVAAAVPTLGAALIIHAGTGGTSLVSRVLSLRPMVFVGLISYSLYLWHWPVIVYTELYLIGARSLTGSALIVAASFILAVLSWKYVETPFRTKRLLPRTGPLLGAAAATLFVIACAGVSLWALRGLPNRQYVRDVAGAGDARWKHWGRCDKAFDSKHNLSELCSLGVADGKARFLLWGDSHARALATGIDKGAARHGFKGKYASHSGCPPLTGVGVVHHPECSAFNRAVLGMLASAPNIKTVVLAARWPLDAEGKPSPHEGGETVRLVDLKAADGARLPNPVVLQAGLKRTIDALHRLGKHVAVVRSIPEIDYSVPSAYLIAQMTGRDANAAISPPIASYQSRNLKVDPIFARIASRGAVEFVDPSSYLCTERCMVVHDGRPLYRDNDHLSEFGATYLVRSGAFDDVFAKLTQAPDKSLATEPVATMGAHQP
ncbi:acyltransferase family protein [Frateuria hangzhouensis]|uniref:acyltransferase family protein n=1 Tax=Frateuria hangzhouensis TaxID=2995589 RepID=UPI002260CFD1|nr:acyltransferase family protein [Frateuria sp. STR12]MCX7512756.1 acyltransferase family protein [Frateuria sp. STR12]